MLNNRTHNAHKRPLALTGQYNTQTARGALVANVDRLGGISTWKMKWN